MKDSEEPLRLNYRKMISSRDFCGLYQICAFSLLFLTWFLILWGNGLTFEQFAVLQTARE